MNLLDLFIVFFLVIGIIQGFRRGFFVELASLVSMLLGIFIAIKFSHLTQSWLIHQTHWNPKTVQVAAFALTFILVIIGVSMLAKVFTTIANLAFLGWVNSVFGSILALLRGILVLSILLNLFQKVEGNFSLISQEAKQKSALLEPIQEVSRKIYPSISKWFENFQSTDFEFDHQQEH
ncbi:CvpA family protein [Flavobacterium sp. CYK-4]|uniref:CvpA family protein n=1 Tax=Flavobacterium lotistagni TaxID=2709660 RepID=UPI00140D11E4|nr:CvpA family protein [Flavobacterium lotistagni]NHM06060.1 CvpA family protein [Flavobacterium lotistagni]